MLSETGTIFQELQVEGSHGYVRICSPRIISFQDEFQRGHIMEGIGSFVNKNGDIAG